MCRTMLVVVLYDKIYKDSLTLNSLKSRGFSDVDLMIVNHGHNPVEFDKTFIHTLGFFVKNIVLKEFLDGRSLSDICNWIINDYSEYERFVFFDDDSMVAKRFIKNLNFYYKNDVDLQIPHIRGKSDRKIHYPVIDDSVFKSDDGVKIHHRKALRSLGTGLVIYRSLINKIKATEMDVFDSRFTLRENDCCFFTYFDSVKLKKTEITIQVVNTVVHSLFRANLPTNKLRAIERIREGLSSIKI